MNSSLKTILKKVSSSKNAVFLDTARHDSHNKKSLLFLNPAEVICCYHPKDVEIALKKAQALLDKGWWLAGFLSYEAGYGLEDKLYLDKNYRFPLVWLGVYKKPEICDGVIDDISASGGYQIENLRPNISRQKYIKDIKAIKRAIEKGLTYQVNYTFKDKFILKGSANKLYAALRKKQQVSYSCFIKTDKNMVLSFSPELFLRRKGDLLEVRPMKGTIKRGHGLNDDRSLKKQLALSKKDRAENIMIVDLLRNDLGRISETGSVKTKKIFKVETYKTLHQMISIITSRLKKGVDWLKIFKNIFPSGSVTGAPKIMTMEIIRKIEKEPRHVYTGSVGYISPENEAVFNVAIRTIISDIKSGRSEMGIGSGIVYDSESEDEYKECILKSDFLTKQADDFKLIETIRYKPASGYYLIGLHLERLKKSSKYFGFCYNEGQIRKKLNSFKRKSPKNKDSIVRLLLSKDGKLELNFKKLTAGGKEAKKIAFSKAKTDSRDVFFYHKTTRRSLYDSELKKARKKGLFDIIFENEKGQITEGAITNIIIEKGKKYYTPSAECGLLKGVYREHLFRKKNFPLREKILYKSDIIEADSIYICNSVRGLISARLI